jgi:hypothetical protein
MHNRFLGSGVIARLDGQKLMGEWLALQKDRCLRTVSPTRSDETGARAAPGDLIVA